MPWLNRVLEELGIHHEEHTVPPKLLKSIEEMAKRTTAKNVTAAVESKKRKGADVSKAIGKRQKTGPSVVAISTAASATSSVEASADTYEGVAENVGRGPTLVGADTEWRFFASRDLGRDQMEGGTLCEVGDMSRPEPSAAVPMPGVLGDDLSSSEGEEDVGDGGALAPEDAGTGDTSCRRAAGASVVEISEDEAVSRSPVAFRSATFWPQT